MSTTRSTSRIHCSIISVVAILNILSFQPHAIVTAFAYQSRHLILENKIIANSIVDDSASVRYWKLKHAPKATYYNEAKASMRGNVKMLGGVSWSFLSVRHFCIKNNVAFINTPLQHFNLRKNLSARRLSSNDEPSPTNDEKTTVSKIRTWARNLTGMSLKSIVSGRKKAAKTSDEKKHEEMKRNIAEKPTATSGIIEVPRSTNKNTEEVIGKAENLGISEKKLAEAERVVAEKVLRISEEKRKEEQRIAEKARIKDEEHKEKEQIIAEEARKAAEEARIAMAEKEQIIAKEARKAADEKLAEAERVAVEKDLRISEEKRKEEQRIVEERIKDKERKVKEQIAAEEARKAAEEARIVMADNARVAAEEARKAAEDAAEEARIAVAETARKATEEAKIAVAENARIAAEEARKATEEAKIAVAENARIAEENRREDERIAAEETKIMAEEAAAKAVRVLEEILEENRKEEERIAAEKTAVEEATVAEERRKEEERIAAENTVTEKDRIADSKRKEEELLVSEEARKSHEEKKVVRRDAIKEARRQPKSDEDDAVYASKYANMSAEERAFSILLDLGLIDLAPDPDDPDDCSESDGVLQS